MNDDGDWLAGSSDDEMPLAREAKSREQRFWNEGFRDGVEEGKEQTIQHGFNIGFHEGYDAGRQWGGDRAYGATLRALQSKMNSGELSTSDHPISVSLKVAQEEPGIDRIKLVLSQLLVTAPDINFAADAAKSIEAEEGIASERELRTAFASLRTADKPTANSSSCPDQGCGASDCCKAS